MNPKPRSLTSRLIVPPGIRVSLGARRCPRCGYQVSFHLNMRGDGRKCTNTAAQPPQRPSNRYARVQRVTASLHVHRERRAQPGNRLVEIVSELKHNLVLAGRKL